MPLEPQYWVHLVAQAGQQCHTPLGPVGRVDTGAGQPHIKDKIGRVTCQPTRQRRAEGYNKHSVQEPDESDIMRSSNGPQKVTHSCLLSPVHL
jgi:hypothetical protein